MREWCSVLFVLPADRTFYTLMHDLDEQCNVTVSHLLSSLLWTEKYISPHPYKPSTIAHIVTSQHSHTPALRHTNAIGPITPPHYIHVQRILHPAGHQASAGNGTG